MTARVFLYPTFAGPDEGDGGVRRVVEAQQRHLEAYGIELVDNQAAAKLIAAHIMAPEQLLRYPDRPLVAHSHGLYWAEYDWERWAYRANAGCMETIRQADAVTAPTEWVAQAIRRNTMRPVTVIGHGIEPDEWPERAGPDKGFVLWNKTRVDAVCDPEAVGILASMAPDVPFVTTFGPEGRPNVGITGTLPYDLARKTIVDCAVYLATARETFGIGTVEAMAAGAPVLGWRWGGQAEFVEHKVTGYLATPGDFQDLLEGLRYCLANRVKLGTAARKAALERFNWRSIVGRYAELYHGLAATWGAESGPKVSVVVPAYGLEHYLRDALDSVRAQSLKDWECIVVDDASPDNCGAVAEEYAKADPRFRVIHNPHNQYLAGALNTGISAARGRYILPLDADNQITTSTLEALAHALDNNRRLHIAYGRVQFMREDRRPDESVGADGHSGWPPEFSGDAQVFARRDDGRPSNLVPSTSMYRRRVWELTGGYRRRFRTGEDADFWTRATSYGFRAERVTEDDTLLYRNRPDSMSRTEQRMDWTNWMPWAGAAAPPPAGIITEAQVPVPTYDPPLIAVVIPVGPGHSLALVDALDSVDAQTFRHWECIVVNDTGAPLPWVPTWARVIELAGSEGVAKARNAGIRAARSRLFVPLDADDGLEPRALELMHGVWAEHGGYVYGDWFERWEGTGEVKLYEPDDYDAYKLLNAGCLHAVTGLYPVAAWAEVGGFDEELIAWEDWDFQLKLAAAGICGTRLPVPIFTYRKDTGARREENYANFERSKEAIRAKWDAYFLGEKTLMGCNSCRGGGHTYSAPPNLVQQLTGEGALPQNAEGYVTVEYTGQQMGSMIFRGPSGAQYRFGGTDSERRKLVALADVDYFRVMSEFAIKDPAPVA